MRRSNFDLETLIERMMGEVVENTDEPSFGEGQASVHFFSPSSVISRSRTDKRDGELHAVGGNGTGPLNCGGASLLFRLVMRQTKGIFGARARNSPRFAHYGPGRERGASRASGSRAVSPTRRELP